MDNPYANLRMPDYAGDFQRSMTNGMNMMQSVQRHRLAMDEAEREKQARGAASQILMGGMGGTVNALSRFASPQGAPANALAPQGANALAQPMQGQQQADQEPTASAWRTLAQASPDLFMQLQKLNSEQRQAVAKEVEARMALAGRAYSAVMGVAPEQREAVYQQLRGSLAEQGLVDLPKQWDEDYATAGMRLGMTVREALSADNADLRLEADVADDQADNERADENAASLHQYRQGQLGNARRGQDISSRDRRRGQDVSSGDRRRGQDISSRDRRNRPAKGGKAEPVAMLNGRRIVVRNGQWVDAETGKAVQ